MRVDDGTNGAHHGRERGHRQGHRERARRARRRVVMLCREPAKAEAARAEVRARTPAAQVDILPLDLRSLASVRACAAAVLDACPRIDVLVNNAGVFPPTLRTTADGFEEQIGVNHLGHFLLTNLLLERLAASAPARVVTVSSMMHAGGAIDFASFRAPAKYDAMSAYRQSKLANILFANELARGLAGRGSRRTRCTRRGRDRDRARRAALDALGHAAGRHEPREGRAHLGVARERARARGHDRQVLRGGPREGARPRPGSTRRSPARSGTRARSSSGWPDGRRARAPPRLRARAGRDAVADRARRRRLARHRGGQAILDAAGGAIVANIGHGRREVAEAYARERRARELRACRRSRPRAGCAWSSACSQRWLPAGLTRVAFTSGGSEAVDAALRVARPHHVARGPAGRWKVIGRDLSYHGTTLATLAVGGHTKRRAGFEPWLADLPKAPACYCCRCPLGMAYPGCGVACADAVEAAILRAGPDTVAAVIAEPIGGSTAGALVPPDEYWPSSPRSAAATACC